MLRIRYSVKCLFIRDVLNFHIMLVLCSSRSAPFSLLRQSDILSSTCMVKAKNQKEEEDEVKEKRKGAIIGKELKIDSKWIHRQVKAYLH